MAAEASKDQRVTELFRDGSHHLSVIALNQNMYFSKNPTQRRNCYCLVLFNNPVDKQPIMTLARQMYPTQPHELMRRFYEAVCRQYGYLLVDLKPTTPEALRMRTDVFSTKGTDKNNSAYFLESPRAVQTYSAADKDNMNLLDNNQNSDYMTRKGQNQTENTIPSYDDCGVVFENNHDLQTHVKGWCPRQMSLKRTALVEEDGVFTKRSRYDDHSEEMDNDFEYDSTSSDLENDAFEELPELSRKRNKI